MLSDASQSGSAAIRMLNIGYGNLILAARVVAIVSPQSSPMRRLREEAVAEVSWSMQRREGGPAL